MHLGLSLGLTGGGQGRRANALLMGEANGFAVPFTDDSMTVVDSTTGANRYSGRPAGKLSITGALSQGPEGVYFDGSNYARLLMGAWPNSTSAVSISCDVMLDDVTAGATRTIFMIDGAGTDLLALQITTAGVFRFFVGTGASSFTIGSASVVADTWMRVRAVAGPSGAFLMINDTVEVNAGIYAGNPSTTTYAGIGAQSAATGGAAAGAPLMGRMRYLVGLPREISQEAAQQGPPFFSLSSRLGVAGIGDSHTYDPAWTWPLYPELLADAFGASYLGENRGVSGNSTAEMYSRRRSLLTNGTPDITVIYGGTNDVKGDSTVQASPAPTTTTFSVATGKGTRYAKDGWITVGGVSCQVASVLSDAITLTAPLGGAPAAGTAVIIDTQKNLESLVDYAQAQGCTKVLVCGQHYLNFASAGDDVVTGRADLVTLRGLQSAAATAAGAIYCDLYDWMRDLIVAGTYVQGSASWHVSPTDPHLNAIGQTVIADAMEAAIRAQGWV